MIAGTISTKALCTLLINTFVKPQKLVHSSINIVRRRTQSPIVLVKYIRWLNQINPRRPLLITAFTLFGASKVTEMASNHMLADLLQNADQFSCLMKDQSSADIKWRQGRAMFKLSKVDTKRKDELIRNSYALVDAALKINDQDFAIHKWFAILLDANSELDGVKVRVSQLETVKKHMTGTYEEALEHFLKAEEKKPNYKLRIIPLNAITYTDVVTATNTKLIVK